MSKHILIAIAFLAVPATSHAERRIGGSYSEVNHDCGKDPTVDIVSNRNQVTITGACKSVRVAGIQNQVTIASTIELSVPGDENQVRAVATDVIRASGSLNDISYRRSVTPNKSTQVTSSGRFNDIKKVEQ